ncbi:DUF4429 domain-containing protein [Stackebrandtia nassauensis]|uniref:DUF4429 domain-containing protein n=1 Tax=Stackebrandtia nassauensis TaxID=283811 RepID=UPI0011850326|nr:DUF4429 domain-containing protein [Stackebrandtia nassauensis]
MTWRFHSPPGWPPPPVGFVPAPGWLPDPSWPAAPQGWNFWIEDDGTLPGYEPTASGPLRLAAADGTAILDDSTLTFEFTASGWRQPFKAAVGQRVFPLDAIDDVTYKVPGRVRNGSVSLKLKQGRDNLREFLKDDKPSDSMDPDCLVIAPEQAAYAELFVARLRNVIVQAAASDRPVTTGTLPIELKGSDGTAFFDGHHLYLEFSGWTTDRAKKDLGGRSVPVTAIRGVQVRHPGMSGWIRFVPVEGPPRSDLSPTQDPHTLCLNADAASRYVIFAAAVARALPRQPLSAAEHSPKAAPNKPKPKPAPAPSPPHGATTVIPMLSLSREVALTHSSGLRLRRLPTGGERVEVVGESYYQPALRTVAEGRTVAPGALGDAIEAIAVLVPEPHNRYDSKAVRIDLLDKRGKPHKAGYLPRYLAATCHDDLARMGKEFGYCPARIMGGGRGRSYGVHLHLSLDVIRPFRNPHTTGFLLHPDRQVTVTKEHSHQAVLSRFAPGPDEPRAWVMAELSLVGITSGKYRGEQAIEVSLDGERVGETTRNQARYYERFVREIRADGGQALCEGYVYPKNGEQLEVELFLPKPG